MRYKGAREIGYKEFSKIIDPTDVIKFGKKVNYESRITNHQVMEEHLLQMRKNLQRNKQLHSIKIKEEMDFVNQMREIEELENLRKVQSI